MRNLFKILVLVIAFVFINTNMGLSIFDDHFQSSSGYKVTGYKVKCSHGILIENEDGNMFKSEVANNYTFKLYETEEDSGIYCSSKLIDKDSSKIKVDMEITQSNGNISVSVNDQSAFSSNIKVIQDGFQIPFNRTSMLTCEAPKWDNDLEFPPCFIGICFDEFDEQEN